MKTSFQKSSTVNFPFEKTRRPASTIKVNVKFKGFAFACKTHIILWAFRLHLPEIFSSILLLGVKLYF